MEVSLQFSTPLAQRMWLEKQEEELEEERLWCKEVKLLKYLESLAIEVNEDLCAQFMSSAIRRSKRGSPRNLIGTVNGVEILFCREFLMEMMDWSFMDEIDWNTDDLLENNNDLCPSPDLDAFFQVTPNSYDKYDLDKISNLNPVWSVRIRGLLSGVWLSRKFKFVSKKKLELIMRANAGEVVCWATIVEAAFRKEFFYLMEFPDEACESPIGPFLTSYINAYLAREEKKNLGGVTETTTTSGEARI